MTDPGGALVAAASDGVDFDGLVVESSAYGYRFETPKVAQRGLSMPELNDVATDDPYVQNWYFWTHRVTGDPGSAQWRFLRWVEHAGDLDPVERVDALEGEGLAREWGELRVRVHRDARSHVYDLRHVDDADAETGELEAYADPLDARDIAKYDDDGEYRPLKSAPTLPHGWVFPMLGPDEAARTVEFVYPASVANWHRERAGDLDVTHWAETADRQTGIYADVADLPRDALAWTAEACCTDGACVKRREWDAADDDALDVPRGDGEFPCREPCSVFVAAARKFATLEREAEREYTLTLTPSELAQLEGVLDAVADGAVGDVRAGDLDDPANRYRARYLRAKRGGDGGFDAATDDAGDDES